MIRDVVIVPAPASDPPAEGEIEACDPAMARVGGLTVIERLLLGLAQAGVRRATIVVGPSDRALRGAIASNPRFSRAGLAVSLVESGDGAPAGDGPFLLARRDRIYSSQLLTAAVAAEPGRSSCHDFGASGLSAVHPDGSGDLAALTHRAAAVPSDAWWHEVGTPAQRKAAEARLIASLRKPSDGPIARTIIRPISLRITRVLMNTALTPNQITLANAFVGFIGIGFLLQATWWGLAIGAALFVAQCILDHPDGEIARLKFLGSRLGQWLDHISDDVSNTGYGLSLGWAVSRMTGEPAYFWMALAGAFGFVIYNAVLAVQLTVVHKSGSPFDFRWWFQKENVYVKHSLAEGGFGAKLALALHACSRRDVFLFGFLALCLARLPQLAVIWFTAVAGLHGLLSLVHAMAGGIGKARGHDSRVATTAR